MILGQVLPFGTNLVQLVSADPEANHSKNLLASAHVVIFHGSITNCNVEQRTLLLLQDLLARGKFILFLFPITHIPEEKWHSAVIAKAMIDKARFRSQVYANLTELWDWLEYFIPKIVTDEEKSLPPQMIFE